MLTVDLPPPLAPRINSQQCWSSTRKCCDIVPLRTVQTHYLREKHGVATSSVNENKVFGLWEWLRLFKIANKIDLLSIYLKMFMVKFKVHIISKFEIITLFLG